jgi:release factor glutamine methyltransferase
MNVRSWLKNNKSLIDPLDAELILAHVLNQDRIFLVSHDDDVLTNEQISLADNLVKKRKAGWPLAYLTGHKEFYGREFFVDENVLIPRPETEETIDVVKSLRPRTIADIGTGSGCIAITLKLELPDAKVFAYDISQGALSVVSKNAARLDVDLDKLELSDLTGSVELDDVDVVVANLPYVDPTWDFLSPEIKKEPSLALFADDHGLSLIKRLIKELSAKHYSGYLVLESDISQQEDIVNFALDNGFEHQKTTGLITLFKA